MGECGPTAKLVRKSAAYTWLFLARFTRPSAIRFIGQSPSHSDGQSQDGSLSLPSGNCVAASKQRLHYGRCRNRPVLVSAPRRVSGACAVSRDGSHTGGSPLPTDLQFLLHESTLYEVFHFWQDNFAHVRSEFGSNGTEVRVAPRPSDQEFGASGTRTDTSREKTRSGGSARLQPAETPVSPAPAGNRGRRVPAHRPVKGPDRLR
jgi:hypothetical protein